MNRTDMVFLKLSQLSRWKVHKIARDSKSEMERRIAKVILKLDGGPGSGNFGHAGRPGRVGGSGGGGGSIVSGMNSKTYSRSKDGYAQFISKKAANQFSEECGKRVKLTNRQKETLAEYQVSSAEMNARLRKGDVKSDGYSIKDLDTSISKATLPDDVILFRGVSGESMNALGITSTDSETLRGIIGQTISDPAYLSTTSDQSIMRKFTRSPDGNAGVGIIIKAAAGSKALPISAANSEYGNRESEFILPRNAQLKATGIIERDGISHLVVEYVSGNDESVSQ